MTQVVNLTKADVEERIPIQFIKHFEANFKLSSASATVSPSSWDVVELIKTGAETGYPFDLFFAYDAGCKSDGCFFIGHFNDGFVEQK